MIRHSSSFFISFILHTALAIALFYTYKNVVAYENKSNDKVEVKLCYVVEKKAEVKPQEIPKPKPTPQPKPIIAPIKKTLPILKKEIKPQEQITEEDILKTQTDKDINISKNIKSKELSVKQEYLDEHIKKISQLLQDNLYYPRSARKRGITGEVIVKFRLSKNATVHSIEIVSANSEILSRAAIKTIEDLSGEFPKPGDELLLQIPIKYSLSRQ